MRRRSSAVEVLSAQETQWRELLEGYLYGMSCEVFVRVVVDVKDTAR